MTTSDLTLSPRFDAALALAIALHRGQRRTGSGVPYIAHLLSVSALVLEDHGGEDEAIAALLHDAVEDQGGLPTLARIRERFGDAVADIVLANSDETWDDPERRTTKAPWRARKEKYIADVAHKSPGALRVSLADKVHNARAIVADLALVGPALWDRFTGRRDGTLWYYRALGEAFAAVTPALLPESRLPAMFAIAVAEMTEAASG
jgi:(p)ppGpp synthase/HD superfamily hydrolase